jgi:hypothetical protein
MITKTIKPNVAIVTDVSWLYYDWEKLKEKQK